VKRVRTAKGRKVSSTRWLERQLNDPYVRRAKAEGYRSRAAYKLIELDEKFGLLKGLSSVVDLGIAPGGWSQVVRKRAPKAKVAGIDLLPTDPIDGVAILQMDFMDERGPGLLREALGGEADLVLSDMAPNITGVDVVDQARAADLEALAVDFALQVLAPRGALVMKVFQGAGFQELLGEARRRFTTVRMRKPRASRSRSSETYLVARGPRPV